jgi:bacterioferritin (cytochrome b1)
MQKLARHNRDKLIDILSERLAFERAGVKLYDVVLAKMRSLKDPVSLRLFAPLQDFREHEKEHEEWLEAQLRTLGATAHEITDLSDLVQRESLGIERVVNGDDDVVHLVHALLTAELVDNAGWELLLELADDADDDVARREFRKRLHEEEEHLAELRRAMLSIVRRQVLGSIGTSPPAE